MRVFVLVALLLACCAQGRQLQQQILQLVDDTTPLFALGSRTPGRLQITGMLQNFVLDQDPIDSLLSRPSSSFLDVSWANWVDQRLELFDLFQELMAPTSRPGCSHMHAASAMDDGMVSYLASSRFGPAILTTYAQQAGEDQSEFDYRNVNLPAGLPLQRTYEEASLQDEMSSDADKAFELAEIESRMLSQEPRLSGYFEANMKPKTSMLIGQLDGDSESLQPMILTQPNVLDLVEGLKAEPESLQQEADTEEPQPVDPRQLAIFVLLLIGCCYVWTCLIVSCIRFRQQDSRRGSTKAPDAYLIVPLAPESADGLEKIQFATDYLPAETYTKPLTA